MSNVFYKNGTTFKNLNKGSNMCCMDPNTTYLLGSKLKKIRETSTFSTKVGDGK